MVSSDSQIDKPQLGRPKRAELSDVNRNTGAQSINTEPRIVCLRSQSFSFSDYVSYKIILLSKVEDSLAGYWAVVEGCRIRRATLVEIYLYESKNWSSS